MSHTLENRDPVPPSDELMNQEVQGPRDLKELELREAIGYKVGLYWDKLNQKDPLIIRLEFSAIDRIDFPVPANRGLDALRHTFSYAAWAGIDTTKIFDRTMRDQ